MGMPTNLETWRAKFTQDASPFHVTLLDINSFCHPMNTETFWVCIFTMIDDHEKKVAQDTGHIRFIFLVYGDYYEDLMVYNNTTNNIVHQEDKDI